MKLISLRPWQNQCRRSQPLRPAYTLIEMLFAISIASVAMGVMGILLNGVWRVRHSMDDSSFTLDTLQRLARQFRDDVHQAESATIRTGGSSADAAIRPAELSSTEAGRPSKAASEPASQCFTLRLFDGKQVDCQVIDGAVNRTLKNADTVLARESYALPPEAVVKWEITSADFNSPSNRWQGSLLITYPQSQRLPELSQRLHWRVDALAGLAPHDIRLNLASANTPNSTSSP